MLNRVSIVGLLKDIDEKNSLVRYIEVKRNYKNSSGQYDIDLFPCIMWSKTNKCELFSYQNGTLVALDGRLELIEERVLIIVESITYLLGRKIEINTRGS